MKDIVRMFAYGSNMLVARMTAPNRSPSAKLLGIGHVKYRRLAFRKRSRDGSGKCDIAASKQVADAVYGVLYEVPATEIPALNKAEGCGAGYHVEPVSVFTPDNKIVEAETYVADAKWIDEALRPYDWYIGLVKAGAEQHKLPVVYRDKLDEITAVADPKMDRETKLEAEKALQAYVKSKTTPFNFPEMTVDRLGQRILELAELVEKPERFREFPLWTQNILITLRDQLFPKEMEVMFSQGNVFLEGLALAVLMGVKDFGLSTDGSGFLFNLLSERVRNDTGSEVVVSQLRDGTIFASKEFREQVLLRLFSPDRNERRLFADGLSLGHRLKDLIDQHPGRTTDATGIYFILWLYWPEISKMRTVAEVSRSVEPFFAATPNLVGSAWEDRFRKLASRIGLRFRPNRHK